VLAAVVNPADLVISSIINAADLSIGGISTPSSGMAGNDVTVSYTVTNNATEPTLSTSWVDSIYLSQSSTIDPTAKLIGRVQHSGAVAGLASYKATLTAPLPGVVPGIYNVLVLADSEGFVPDVNRANNVGVSSRQMTAGVQTLTPGVAFSAMIANGQNEYFSVDLPAGSTPRVTASFSAAGGGAVYERFQGVPDEVAYDELAYDATTQTQQMILAGTHGGTYYLLVQGRTGSDNAAPFSITVDEVGLQVSRVSPSKASNTGVATLTVYGADFAPGAVVSLVGASGTVRTAISVVLANNASAATSVVTPAALVAKFDLTGVPEGTYGVRVVQGLNVSDLPGAFTVTALPSGHIDYSVYGASAIRPHQTGTYLIFEYKNTGGTFLPAPTVTIQAQNALLWPPVPGITLPSQSPLLAESTGGGAGGGGGGGGARDIIVVPPPGGGSPSITFVAPGPPGDEGYLPPGYDGFFTIHYLPINFGAHVTSSFSLQVPPQAETPIDWSSQKDSLRPSTISPDAWDAIFANFVARVGNTYGQLQDVLSEDESYLGVIGDVGQFSDVGVIGNTAPLADLSRLLAFELQQDSDPLPTPTLAAMVDASAPAPGLPLTFGRVFMQSIAGRYQLGPLGRGWVDTWDMAATADSSGNVTIQGAGSTHAFTLEPDGTYKAAPGDYDTLSLSHGAYTLRDKQGIVYVFQPDGLLSYEQDTNSNRITATYTEQR
jgi:hypothetical protein